MKHTGNETGRCGTTRRATLRALGVAGAGIGWVAPSTATARATGAAGDIATADGQPSDLSLTTRVVAADGDADDGVGHGVAVGEGGDTVALGAVRDGDPNGTGGGSVYVFRRPDAVALDGTDDLTGDVTLDRRVDPRETDVVYRGQVVTLTGLSDGETVTVRDADSGLALTERTVSGSTAQIDTIGSRFEQFVGRSFELGSPSLGTVPFTFVEMGYEVEAARVSVDNGAGATTDLTVGSTNRAGYTHVVSSPDLTGAELAAVVSTTGFVNTDVQDADGDGDRELVLADGGIEDTLEIDARGLSPGEYTLEFGVYDAVASDEVTVEVVGVGPYVQEAKVAPADGDAGARFGGSVALSADGTTLVAGARLQDGGAGAAYVFDRDGREWDLTDRLTADSAAGLGDDVAVTDDGSLALVGAPAATDDAGDPTGAVYAFERRGALWSRTAAVVPDGVDAGDAFGGAVALSGDGTTALVGATGEDGGAAYVLTRDEGWRRAARLTPAGDDAGDAFGGAVALSGDGTTALVGAAGGDGGSAYVYGRDGGDWSFDATLLGAGEGGDFGRSVALAADGRTALVGAPERGTTGAAFLFGRVDGGWQRLVRVTPAEGGGPEYGHGVALGRASGVGVVGDPSGDNANGTDAGTGYVYGADTGLADRFDDGDGEVEPREVLAMIDAYNEGDEAISAQDVLAAIEAYNADAGWSGVDG